MKLSIPASRALSGRLAAAALIAILAGCSMASPAPEAVRAPVPGTDLHGVASWYGLPYHGRKTANGETYNMHDLTAAHRTLPFGSRVRVERTDNGRFVDVRINDRGPFVRGRVIDLSKRSAGEIDMLGKGVTRVRLIPLRVPPKKKARWLVLIGGFRNRREARKFAGVMRGRAERSRLVRGWHGNREKYRVQLEGFRDRWRGANLAAALRERGYEAFLVRVG
jgi:rare lipoprotein A